jgi:RimJ/RimL family protein N-acetyltransferase
MSSSFHIRAAVSADAAELADLINPIIRAGGTTAIEIEFSPASIDQAEISGPSVICCHVAIDRDSGEIVAFQTLGRYPGLPPDVADIGTFARIDRKQSGAGSALFAATRACALAAGLSAINATIRADNTGGLAYYSKQGFIDHSVSKGVPLASGRLVDRIHKRFEL